MARQLFANSRFDADGLIMSKLALMLEATRAPYLLPPLRDFSFVGAERVTTWKGIPSASKLQLFALFLLKTGAKREFSLLPIVNAYEK